jgi:hypothetical protein
MNMEEDRAELERLFWGVIARYDPTAVPTNTEPVGVAAALARALAVIYHRQAEEVRAALRRVAAGLPNEREYAEGQVHPSEYNLRVTSVIQGEMARLDRLEAEVQRILNEMGRT